MLTYSFFIFQAQTFILRRTLLLAMAIHAGGMATAGGMTETIPPELERPIHVQVPTALRHLDLSEYRAHFLVRIGRDGRVMDKVCLEASHPGLINRAESALAEARFRPALEDNESVVSDIMVSIPFHHPTLGQSGTVEVSGLDHIQTTITGVAPGEVRFHATTPRELDEPLRIIERGQTYIPTDADGTPVHGSAVAEFYVNEKGETRMPKIIEADHEAIADAAIRNVLETRFEPPTRNKRPTVVRVRMPFSFDP